VPEEGERYRSLKEEREIEREREGKGKEKARRRCLSGLTLGRVPVHIDHPRLLPSYQAELMPS
jgi:hypothetical protein